MTLISIVVPAYNEEANIQSMYEKLTHELQPLPFDYEIMFINDESRDGTLQEILALADEHDYVKYISRTRNGDSKFRSLCSTFYIQERDAR